MSKKRLNYEVIDLIESVEQRPCIWKKSLNEYKDRRVKNKAWKEVCSILDANYQNLNAIEQRNFGAIFEGVKEDEEIAFRLAIDTINQERRLPYQIKPLTVRLEPDEMLDLKHNTVEGYNWVAPFQAFEASCNLISKGVVGIFTSLSEENSIAVQSLCDTKAIPVVNTRITVQQDLECCTINAHPYAQTLARAFADVVREWNWNSFTILYENQESLPKITQMLRIFNTSGHSVVLRQLYTTPNGRYRDALKGVWKSGQKNFILDCSTENLNEILQQAQQIGLLTNMFSYIIINLEMHTIDLSPYQYSETNFTGFQLVDPTSSMVEKFARKLQDKKDELMLSGDLVSPAWMLESGTALMVDAVFLFAKALEDLGDFDIKPLYCNASDNWIHGETVFNSMKMQTIDGLTGLVQFDNPSGFRKDFTLSLIELSENGIINVGFWNSVIGTRISRTYPEINIFEKDSLVNRSFNIIICETKPYGILKPTHTKLTGNDRFEGFAVDLIEELAKLEKFNYTFIVREDGNNGEYNATLGKWVGMIGNVIDGDADLAITDLTINQKRQKVVDFTSPFMNLGIQMLYSKPQPEAPGFFTFASPFAVQVWLLLGVAFFGVSFMLFILSRLCQSEWNNPYPCIEEPEHLENQFTLRNSMWFTLGALMQQGADNPIPSGLSTRILASFWWFFVLIMVSSYTATLAAFLTTEVSVNPFDDVEELLKRADKMGVTMGAKLRGATHMFFKGSHNKLYKEIGDYMDAHPEYMPSKNSEGVKKAEQGKYVFFMESTTIKYEIQGSCNLQAVGQQLDEKGYGIAMRKDMWYRGRLSAAILKLQETGVIDDLERKWWYEKREPLSCEDGGDMADAPPLSLKHVSGIFWVAAGGSIIAFAMVFIESALHIIKKHGRNLRLSWEEYKDELRFYFKFTGMVKEVKDGKSETQSTNSQNKFANIVESTPVSYGFNPEVLQQNSSL